MDWLRDLFFQLLIGSTIALVSAYITVRLALKRFRSEKRWLRKMEAYERIIEALHHLKASAQAEIDVVQKPPNSYPAPGPELTQRWREAYLEIEKAVDVGTLLLSEEAHERLMCYRKEAKQVENPDSSFECADAELAASNRCLPDLIRMAKKDLETT